MVCKNCGSALPSRGFICKRCGTMMDMEQIKEQKEHIRNEDNKKIELNLVSDRYSKEPINRDYKPQKENKLLGSLLIVLILIILIIIALLRLK